MNIAMLLSQMYRDYDSLMSDDEIRHQYATPLCFFVGDWVVQRFPHLSVENRQDIYRKMRNRQRDLFRHNGLDAVWPFQQGRYARNMGDLSAIDATRRKWVSAHLQPHQCESLLGKTMYHARRIGGKLVRKT